MGHCEEQGIRGRDINRLTPVVENPGTPGSDGRHSRRAPDSADASYPRFARGPYEPASQAASPAEHSVPSLARCPQPTAPKMRHQVALRQSKSTPKNVVFCAPARLQQWLNRANRNKKHAPRCYTPARIEETIMQQLLPRLLSPTRSVWVIGRTRHHGDASAKHRNTKPQPSQHPAGSNDATGYTAVRQDKETSVLFHTRSHIATQHVTHDSIIAARYLSRTHQWASTKRRS